MALTPAALFARTPDSLRGRVVHAPDSTAVTGHRVVLHRVRSEGGAPVDTARTGPGGRFAFVLPAADTAAEASDRPVYLVTARYGGVLYFGPAVHGGDPPEDYRIDVYPAERATDAAGVVLRSRTLVLAPEGDGTRVMDVVVARGRSGRTLVGPPGPGSVPDSAGGRPPWWTVAVPLGARDLRVLPGAVDPAEVTFATGEARISAVIPPSGQRLVLGYRVPSGSALEIALRHAVERVEVLAGEGTGGVRVPGAGPPDSMELDGRPLHRFRLPDLRPGDTLRVLAGARTGGGSVNAGWMALGAGVALLGAAAWTWRRRRGTGPRRAAGPPERAG